MRKIITTTFITLDGVMQAPGGSKEDAADGFKYGGWQGDYGGEVADNIFDTKIQDVPFSRCEALRPACRGKWLIQIARQK